MANELKELIHENGEFHILCGIYKAVGTIYMKKGEYHFSISEKKKGGGWTYISTYSDTNYLRLIADVCKTLVEYQETADEINEANKGVDRSAPF